jgi:hypothetical protein
VEGFSEQAGSCWIVALSEGRCSLEKIISRRRDPWIALDHL